MKTRIRIHSEHRLGNILARYLHEPATERIGLQLLPANRRGDVTERREAITGLEVDAYAAAAGLQFNAWSVDSLVQVKVSGDPEPAGFAQGRSLRNSGTVERLIFTKQKTTSRKRSISIRTTLQHPHGWKVHHDLVWPRGASWLESRVTIENCTRRLVDLDQLSSFSLCGITPFCKDDAPGRLQLHRIKSAWSMEGRLETRSLEQLNLERSWSGWGVRCERFGVTGSLPTNGYFPFAAIEDKHASVTWAATVAQPGSWQMEVYRRDDTVALSGGLADWEFGHWRKRLRRGESFISPSATLACVSGGLDEACDALTSAQAAALPDPKGPEKILPVVFNEWATTWGKPSHQNMQALATRLRGSGVRYLVIDAGWYAPTKGDWGRAHGDWKPNATLYPSGLKATADAIRAEGLVPGLWFEFETCGSDSDLWHRTSLLLQRDGQPVTVGNRRFLDFRKPAVTDYLSKRVIAQLSLSGIGYLKIDYNENIGLGADGAESLGEGLRAHLAGVQEFLRLLRLALPDLIIESCSSGGHRLEPSFLGLTHMSSFSDAHECREIPIIAANLHRLMLPRQCQIWAVLRAGESVHRTCYSLTAAFLGRLCLSGDFLKISKAQHALARAAVDLYRRAAPVIANGRSRRFGPEIKSYRHPEGWQAVRRVSPNGRSVLVIAHTFARPDAKTLTVQLPGPGGWHITEYFGSGEVQLARGETALTWQPGGEFRGIVVRLSRS